MSTNHSKIPQEKIRRIVEALKANRHKYATDRNFAVALGINPAQLSQVLAGNTLNVLSDANWVQIARKVEVDLHDRTPWVTAITPVYKKIYNQLKHCQEKSTSAIFCDEAGIGKTYTAKAYVRENKNAIYIDGSQVKSKHRFVRMMARECGLLNTGRYNDVYADLVAYLGAGFNKMLVIVDEAGDLEYTAFLELKALWNATENTCGWYMMGADGLEAKIKRSIEFKRIGFTEIFSRYGRKFQSVTPRGKEDKEKFFLSCAAAIIKANAPETTNVQEVIVKIDGSIRRIHTELTKLK